MRSILLIDDDEPLRAMLATAITGHGYIVRQAADGVEGMKSFRTAPADLVITDIVMPNQEGTALVTQLHREFPGLGIIAISGGLAQKSVHYLKTARLLGATRVLLKPFTTEALLQAIEEVLARSSRVVSDGPSHRQGEPPAEDVFCKE